MRTRRNAPSTGGRVARYCRAMSPPALKRLLREWAALIAVLAFVLGPLALGVQRSLGALDNVAMASGAKPLALCLPVMPDADPSSGGGPDCDHCTPAQTFGLATPIDGVGTRRLPTDAPWAAKSIRVASFARAPPARGPPTA
jgi:hypothetical protein